MKKDYEAVIRQIYKTRFFVNHGPLAQEFEAALCSHFSSKHAITIGNSTLALLIAVRGFLTDKVGIAPGAGSEILDALKMAAVDFVVGLEGAESAVVEGCTPPSGVQRVVTYSTFLPKQGTHKSKDGLVSVYSLGPESNTSTLQGGVIITDNDHLAEVFRNIRSSYGTRGKKDVTATCNGRFSEFQAGLGLLRLKRMSRSLGGVVSFLTYSETAALFTDLIRERKPFAVTRLGDGEIATLMGQPPPWVAPKICRAWGYSPKKERDLAFKDLGQVLVTALRKSDILGFLNLQPGRENQITSFRSDHLNAKWSLLSPILAEHDIDLSNKTIIDHQFFRSREFGCIENLQRIVRDAPLHIVSPHAKVVAANLQRFLTNPIRFTVTDRGIFFRDRDPEIEVIKHNVREGEVVLFACGGGYKDLAVMLRDDVGVAAIDIGSTMDAWAGLADRGWLRRRGIQEYLILGEGP